MPALLATQSCHTSGHAEEFDCHKIPSEWCSASAGLVLMEYFTGSKDLKSRFHYVHEGCLSSLLKDIHFFYFSSHITNYEVKFSNFLFYVFLSPCYFRVMFFLSPTKCPWGAWLFITVGSVSVTISPVAPNMTYLAGLVFKWPILFWHRYKFVHILLSG